MSNEGARCLLESLKTNSSLCVLDIRSNPLVGKTVNKYCLFETTLLMCKLKRRASRYSSTRF